MSKSNTVAFQIQIVYFACIFFFVILTFLTLLFVQNGNYARQATTTTFNQQKNNILYFHVLRMQT